MFGATYQFARAMVSLLPTTALAGSARMVNRGHPASPPSTPTLPEYLDWT